MDYLEFKDIIIFDNDNVYLNDRYVYHATLVPNTPRYADREHLYRFDHKTNTIVGFDNVFNIDDNFIHSERSEMLIPNGDKTLKIMKRMPYLGFIALPIGITTNISRLVLQFALKYKEYISMSKSDLVSVAIGQGINFANKLNKYEISELLVSQIRDTNEKAIEDTKIHQIKYQLSEQIKLNKVITDRLMNITPKKPCCSKCATEFTYSKYSGYYEQFEFWEQNCCCDFKLEDEVIGYS